MIGRGCFATKNHFEWETNLFSHFFHYELFLGADWEACSFSATGINWYKPKLFGSSPKTTYEGLSKNNSCKLILI